MSRTLYALLVGINDYPSSVPPLGGCVNDITAFEAWLAARAAGEFQLRVHRLLDGEAKREAVIAGFRDHLALAGPDDMALFYYSGHGSQENAPQEFWHLEPDHLDETLVCWDSREPSGWDLADKELAYLIAHVAQRGAHVVVILDSCHSGSATRDIQPQTAVRWIPADTRPRPLESFLFAPSEVASRAVDVQSNPSGWLTLPEGRHVLLAACQDSETAKEYRADGKSWGAFSYFLRTTLEGASGMLTYRDLFKQAQARVRVSISAQTPQLEATQPADVEQPFLGGAVTARPPYFTVTFDGGGWVLDAGSIHGLPAPFGRDTTTLALFPLEASAEEMRQLSNAVAQAQVVQVLPQSSRVEQVGEVTLDATRAYRAVVTSLPMPPVGVELMGDAEGLDLVRSALSLSTPTGQPSLYVQEAHDAPQLRLVAREGQYTLTYPADERPLTTRLPGYTVENARLAVQRLEHIARWLKTADLRNPASQLPSDAIVFKILRDNVEQDPGQLLFEYRYHNGKWEQPSYWVYLKNQSDRTLYCAVLGLWESFGIEPVFSGQPVIKLEPGQESSRQVWASVPDEVWKQGITDRRDTLKLIVCTDDFDARLLGQGKLDVPRELRTARGLGPTSTLGRLMQRVQMREGSDRPAEMTYSDWLTAQVVMTIHRPLDTLPVPRAGQTAALGAGVTLAGHPSLAARARIGSVPPASRDLGTPGLPPILRETSLACQPFSFRVTRGIGPSENLLELCDVQDHTVVTPDHPLSLTINAPLESGEQVMAFGFDGEFFLPLGFARRAGDKTQIDLQRLPAPYGTRDLRGTIRILFQKLVAQPLGFKYRYPVLAVAKIVDDGTVSYEEEPSQVEERVAQARQITLFIHGITGDTRGMAASARHTCGDDLILTFDYESVNTTVEETARSLKARLEAVGLGAGHSKTLRLVVHSLGGLVARWFIEREGGSQIVQRLVILGTPSAGSPWSTVQQWATLGIGLALNGLTAVAWPVKVLGALVSAFEKIDVTMDQFQPGSEFLKTLAASADPHVPYTLIAGNTSVILDALEATPGKTEARLERLLKKLGYGAASLVFFRQPNDIAVSVESVRSIKTDRLPQPKAVEIACDHMTFFASPAGLAALTQALNVQ